MSRQDNNNGLQLRAKNNGVQNSKSVLKVVNIIKSVTCENVSLYLQVISVICDV